MYNVCMNKKLTKLHKRPELESSEIIEAVPLACSDELAAVEFFETQRWGKTPRCPHCESNAVYKMEDRNGQRNKRYLWRCHVCERQFTVRSKTVYEDSRLPLKHWCYAFWRACTSKKGVSALEIKRHCQITYKSALFLMHRIRFAMAETWSPFTPPLGGNKTVEVDETFCGGTPRRLNGQRAKWSGYRCDTNKIPVVAMVERGGEVRTNVVPKVTYKNLSDFLDRNIARGSVVNTDQYAAYHTILYPIVKGPFGKHETVNHAKKEYARHNLDGTVAHVNTCESFFSLLKRGLMGTFHAVSPEHLHRYADEFAFRWNTRRLNDGERLVSAIKKADGKRLIYAEAKAA